jgi:multidrug efflux pump subunit AcrB
MRSAIEFFVRNNKFTFIVTLFFLVIGILGLFRLNAESYPTVDFAAATVTTNYYGASPEEIENEITKPIEDELRTVRGVKDVRSISQSGLSKISIRVDMDNYDVPEVMDDLQKAVQRVTDLPAGIKEAPKFTELNSEEFPAIELAVIGDNENRKRDLFVDYLKDLIEDNKLVLAAREGGYRKREFTVELDKDKLEQYHIAVSDVLQALQGQNRNIPTGDLENDSRRLLVRLDGKVKTIEEVKETFVRSNFSGQNVKVKDVATVIDGQESARVLAKVDGQDATLITVTKKGGADTIALVKDVNKKLATITIPDGLSIRIYNNESEKVQNRMDVLTSNAVTGLVLVVVFLLLFLPGRVGIVASLSLPIAVMATFGLMPMMDMNLNTITILALVIALGMLVDNSVVISENYTRLRQEGLSSSEAAIKSAYQFWLPITGTAMTTIAAFLPMLVTKGVMGEFIKYIPIVVTIALVLSLIESFFLLPMRLDISGKGMKFKKEPTGEVKQDWFAGITKKFEGMMDVLIRRRYLVSLAFGGMIFGALYMLVVVNDFILFPAEQTEIYISRFELPRGSRIESTNEKAGIISKKIKEQLGEDVANIVSQTGVIQVGPNDPKAKTGQNVGMILMYMTREASINLNYQDVLKKLRSIKVPGLEQLTFEVQINGPPVGAPVNATFRSNNMEQLTAVTDNLVSYLGQVDGILNPQVDDIIGENEVHIKLDYEKAARLELNVNSIGNTVKTALEGSVVTKLNLNNKKVELKVQYEDADKKEVADLSSVKIKDFRGNLIPLSKIASIETSDGTPIIKRFDFQRSKTVTADLDESTITSIEANKLLLDEFNKISKNYPEVSVVFGGESENTKESMESLAQAMVLALIAIFAILVFLFRSYLRPLIIMSTIPLGLLGFSIAFYFHNRPSSFLALIGVIGLAGIIVNSGIVLISFIDQMREDTDTDLHEILVQASGLRLRAVLVTSLTTISGLFPTAYGIGGMDFMLIPMTLAMAWGLTSGTVLTLVWVPCAYAILEDMTTFTNKLFSRDKDKESKEEKMGESYAKSS